MTLRARPRAETDVLDIAERIGEDRPRTAAEFADHVLGTFELLERLPLLGSIPPVPELAAAGLRLFTVSRFRKYVILYRPLPDGVEVLRVIDGRRDLPALIELEL